jgi:hypothetical protein
MDRVRLQMGGCVPILCFAFGGLLLAIALFWMASAWLSAPAWATVVGQIEQAGVTSETAMVQGMSTLHNERHPELRYGPDVVYHYRVSGQDYTGFGIGDGFNQSYANVEDAAAAVAPYRQRPTVTVYYDPANPEHSCLDTSPMLGFLPWVIGGIGLLLLALGLWLRRTRQMAEEEE